MAKILGDIEMILEELCNEEFPDVAELRNPSLKHDEWRKHSLQEWDRLAKKLPELIHLAEIQPNNSKGFCRAVRRRVFHFHERAYRPVNPRDCDEALLNAEKSVRGALDCVRALDDEQLKTIRLNWIRLNWIIYTNYHYSLEEDDVFVTWTKITLQLLAGFEVSTGSAPYETGETNKKGRKKLRSDLELDLLIRDLWLIAHDHGGGFTNWPDLDGRAKGTMKQALDLLAQLLPANFLPKAGLAASRVQKLRPDKNASK